MGKFDSLLRTAAPRGIIVSEATPSGRTYEDGAGFARDPKGELLLLAVTNFVSEDTFYESGGERDTRFRELVRQVAAIDPQWIADMLVWLRTSSHMRSASVVGAIEAGRVLSGMGLPYGVTARSVMASVLQRADEPREALAYWLARYGRPLPQWFKRALGDAALRLYTPYGVMKWDSDRAAVRFADVIEFSRVKRHRGDDTGLFKHLLDDRHDRGDIAGLPMLEARAELMAIPVEQRRAALLADDFGERLRAAGMTWEAISGWIQSEMDAAVWEKAIDLMGYGALIRNLANFDRAGIRGAAREKVAGILIDPRRVERSRLLPMAFLNAYNNVTNDFWKPVLDVAATYAMSNVPRFAGRTLVLIDTSQSMNAPFSKPRGRQRADVERLMRWDVAALFGIALGRACEQADIVSFSAGSAGYWGNAGHWGVRTVPDSLRFDTRAGENLLAAVARFRTSHFINGGTDTAGAVSRWYAGHDRVVILTDEQAGYSTDGVLKGLHDKTVYTFNLAGYRYGHAPTGRNHHVVGGLSDAGFAMMAALETRAAGRWPWQLADAAA